MSSTIIQMKSPSDIRLQELADRIVERFREEQAEVSLHQISDVNGAKVLLLVLEKFYMRNASMTVCTIQIIDSGEEQTATIVGTGGGDGLLNISLGANKDIARRAAGVLGSLGFAEVND